MSTLTALIHRYQTSQSLADEDQIYRELRQYAAQERPKFLQEFRSIPIDESSPAHWIYEALSEDSETWQQFFSEEFDRVVAAVASSPDPMRILPLLSQFYLFGQDVVTSLRLVLRKKIRLGLTHASPAVRRGCAALMVDFVDAKDMDELMALAQMAQSDEDWQARYTAFLSLEEVWPSKAEKVKLPLWIRTKGRLANLGTMA